MASSNSVVRRGRVCSHSTARRGRRIAFKTHLERRQGGEALRNGRVVTVVAYDEGFEAEPLALNFAAVLKSLRDLRCGTASVRTGCMGYILLM
jgi:hypothetical protein